MNFQELGKTHSDILPTRLSSKISAKLILPR